ncbi:hypothetical protein BDZ97DRAFT_2072267 [Flammula alnicola]|nr:hypothetical protein BDZ97DRAFT_2072267 [Flammula alnicola]
MDSRPRDANNMQVPASSALITGIYSIFKGTPHLGIVVAAATINSGVTGATFFTVREFSVSPALNRVAPWAQYAQRRRELGIDAPSSEALSPSPIALPELRTNKLLDSGVSGAVTGGLLRGIRSGRRAALPGMLTGAVACTLLQYGYNQLNLLRLRYISKVKGEDRTTGDVPVLRTGSDGTTQAGERPVSFLEAVLKTIGMKPISDEEYLAKLKKTREVYLTRIAELEGQAEEERILQDDTKS